MRFWCAVGLTIIPGTEEGIRDWNLAVVVEPEEAPATAEPGAESATDVSAATTQQKKLIVYADTDGSPAISNSDADNEVVALGDPGTGLLAVLEIHAARRIDAGARRDCPHDGSEPLAWQLRNDGGARKRFARPSQNRTAEAISHA